MVVDKMYKTWLQKQKIHKERELQINAKLLINGWWDRANIGVKLCESIVSLLRLMDAGGKSHRESILQNFFIITAG